MSVIHIADAQGQKTAFDEAEARKRWNEGAIAANALYWREGMPEWRPAMEFFTAPPPIEAAAAPAIPETTGVPRGFTMDPANLTRWLIGLLWAYLVAAGCAALLSIISLATGEAAKPESEDLTPWDVVILLVHFPFVLIVIVTGVIFLMWIHRANRNARGLGAQGMMFTPGWSVGWYFVPIWALWKPYYAMKEIWQASENPGAWQSQTAPRLLRTWWTLWVISCMLGQMAFRTSFRANTGTELVFSEVISLLSNLADIPLCLVAMRLVRGIIQRQTHWAAQPMQSACALCNQPAAPSDLLYLNNSLVCARCKPVLLQKMREGAPTST